MSGSPNICQSCSHENKPGAKFCVNCGSTIAIISNDKLEIFKSYLQDMILDGDDPRNDEENLLKEAVEDIGIPLSLARKVFDEVCSVNSQSNVGIRISYDSTLAKKGVAQGNSILVMRVDNLTTKSIGSVSISITHPEEGTKIDLGKVRSLGPQKSKPIETTLRFNLVGPQLIREGQIKVESLSGVTDVYLLASPIRMSTENSNVSKHIHTSVSQTITTHGGGVVDGSGFKAVEAQLDKVTEFWETVRLMRSNFNDKPSIPDLAQGDLVKSTADEKSTILNEDVIDKSELSEDPSSSDEKSPIEVGPEISNKINDLVKQGDIQVAKSVALNEFVRLLSFYPKSQLVPKGGVYLTSEIDLVLLTSIAGAAKIKRSDVNAIVVNKLSCDSDELDSFHGDATVFSSQGLITLSAKDGLIDLVDKYAWSFLKESGWGVFRHITAPGSYIFSLGDETSDYCLPNLTFDLRKNNSRVDLEDLFTRLEFLFERIKFFSGARENTSEIHAHQREDNDEFEKINFADEQILENESEELYKQDEDLFDEEEQQVEEDELEFAVRHFFVMFAFVSQYCDREYDRPIHVFVEEENGGDVDLDLARSVQALFPKSKLVAICEDDLQSSHDDEGRILNWTGLASVVTRDGIFNVNSDGHGNFDIANKQAFLSWSKFFDDMNGQLVVRYSVPDIWLGSQDNYLVKGCYIDYSNNIDSFIYFEEFFRSDLNDRFEELKNIVQNS